MALSEEKFHLKQTQLIERTVRALHVSDEEAQQLLRIGRQQGVRINSLKGETEAIQAEVATLGVSTQPVTWLDEGLIVMDGIQTLRDSNLVEDGKAYIQNAASWLPVVALNPKPGETILDMCAAPGGKTSHVAQRTNNEAFITANDNSRPRLHKMQRNLERLSVENVTFTLHDATRLSHQLEPESFDAILLDAPCSGEGMMTLDAKKDFESWSVAHIQRLQKLQKKLIVQAWNLLRPGGALVYSTCTMAPEENEAVIDYLLRHNDDVEVQPLDALKNQLDNTVLPVAEWNGKSYDARVQDTLRLKPSQYIEAFFVAKLHKSDVS